MPERYLGTMYSGTMYRSKRKDPMAQFTPICQNKERWLCCFIYLAVGSANYCILTSLCVEEVVAAMSWRGERECRSNLLPWRLSLTVVTGRDLVTSIGLSQDRVVGGVPATSEWRSQGILHQRMPVASRVVTWNNNGGSNQSCHGTVEQRRPMAELSR
jgi:hypothetical protein